MQLQPALHILKSRAPFIPELAIVLGSGLGGLAESAEAKAGTSISFTELPGFPEQSVAGHSGKLMFCEFEGRKVVLQAGRFHYYEGHPLDVVTAPMRLYGRLGVRAVLHTNAAGAINPDFHVGELMVISDHINFMGTNPLIGPNVPPGPRFHDMTTAYDKPLRQQLHAAASAINMRLQEGTYIAVTGPNYESPAEIRAFRILGADAVGMSTVPEVLVARHEGLRVAGISGLCNMGAGILPVTLTHEDVLAAGAAAAKGFEALVRKFVKDLTL
jgi:purine-nucleoside phosphorylase